MPWTRAAAELRITWEALAGITARVSSDAAAGLDRLEGLRRIGIDEKSWGKGSGKYLVIVTDHDAGRVAWIGEGRCPGTGLPQRHRPHRHDRPRARRPLPESPYA